MNATDLVQKYFAVFHAKDRQTAEAMLSDDFTFSSPLDDKIDKRAYFERCWPNGGHQSEFRLEKVFGEGDEVFVTYSCARAEGTNFRNTEFFRTKDGQISQVEVYFGSETAARGNEEELRALLANVAAAIRAKDAKAMVAHYAEDVLAFDVINPLQYRGRDEVERRAEQWVSSWDGEIEFEMRDVTLSVSAETAFCHALHHVAGSQAGHKVDMWWRATTGFAKADTKWVITHIHSSVPFDMNTGKASLDQKPMVRV